MQENRDVTRVERVLGSGLLASEAELSSEQMFSGHPPHPVKRDMEGGGHRPGSFDEYPGQDAVRENLKIYVKAAQKRGRPLDHVLLHGPPGLGKTTLAHILANELQVPFFCTSGPSVERPGDLAGILAGLESGALVFIDEIHRLSPQVEEVLYSAMEDFAIDLVIGQGPTARAVRMDLAPFTLVGATTRISSLSRPFLSRFGIQERLTFYDPDALTTILKRSARVAGLLLDEEGAMEIARRARGTPRIANRLLRRAGDFGLVMADGNITRDIVDRALERLDIDVAGLDRLDRQILEMICDRYQGGPVGIDTLAVSLGEERPTIEDVYEPYLVCMGYLSRGPRGRSITRKGRQHLQAVRPSGEGRESQL